MPAFAHRSIAATGSTGTHRSSLVHRLLAAVFIAWLLSGCVSQPITSVNGHMIPAAAATPCPRGYCAITVNVFNCTAAGGITVDLPYVSSREPVVMRWRIATPDYTFADNGIEFDPADAQFVTLPDGGRDVVFRVLNQHTAVSSTPYYYYINIVQKSTGTPCLKADPFILNN